MFLKLRILFTILSAICIGLAITAGVIWGPIWTVILGLGAFLFYLLMRVFKQYQENEEAKTTDKQPSFLDPAATEPKNTSIDQTKSE